MAKHKPFYPTSDYSSDDGLSPFHREQMQQMLENQTSLAIAAMKVSNKQRDQHRVLRSLIRMGCRVAIRMGYDLDYWRDLSSELFEKCEEELKDKMLEEKQNKSKAPAFSEWVKKTLPKATAEKVLAKVQIKQLKGK